MLITAKLGKLSMRLAAIHKRAARYRSLLFEEFFCVKQYGLLYVSKCQTYDVRRTRLRVGGAHFGHTHHAHHYSLASGDE